jgi:hypothetical protein
MKINMKKLAAWMLALLLVFQMIPVMAEVTQYASEVLSSNSQYRDKLEIGGTSTITVGESVTLTVMTEGYDNLEWSSNVPEVATVEKGVITGVSAGMAKITAKEDNESDTIIVKVIEASAEGTEEDESKEVKTLVIIIRGNKDKITYDGQEHEYSGYTTDCSDSLFDESKLRLVNEEKKITAKECGTYPVKYETSDFVYDDSDVNVIIDVNDGWMQIKPAELIVKADDKTKLGNDDPAFTATITGLAEGDDPSLIKVNYIIEGTHIIPDGDQIQGNYKVKYEAGNLNKGITSTLYNLAEVTNDGKWYRLTKTEITTINDLTEYVKGLAKNGNKTLNEAEYYTNNYNFADQILTYKGKQYAHISRMGDGLEVTGYYTATLKDTETVVAVKQKIGGTTGCLVDNYTYTEKNEIDSFHRNYRITFTDNNDTFEIQDLYNMLSVNGSSDYHRLKRTKITAKPGNTVSNLTILKPEEYLMDRYDFTNVTININGETYRYSPTKPTGLYDSCFTVTFENVRMHDRINGNDSWYNNDDGWLDGSRAQYGDEGENLPRTTVGYHANYKATLYKGTKPPRSVKITSLWPNDMIAFSGAEITLKGELSGFGENVKLQWQYSSDKERWFNEEGANELTFTYTLNDETANYYWRLVAEE